MDAHARHGAGCPLWRGPAPLRALVALDSEQGKALSLVTFFVALDKESDPAACGRKPLMAAFRHSLPRKKQEQQQSQNGFRRSPE
ncbi:hypothetical protein [Lysobacter enzymogenes]|uniref:hypothetical protein n=1 Tax=Lysobacter enzymogenes TaxID=69 RepID=UPI001AF9493F|nr:hypothetical protein [Lysobacter enzymogenes]QQQ00336.1 hypothetical protein JHW41_19915 [Lysobacter enzymogenes]